MKGRVALTFTAARRWGQGEDFLSRLGFVWFAPPTSTKGGSRCFYRLA